MFDVRHFLCRENGEILVIGGISVSKNGVVCIWEVFYNGMCKFEV